MAQSISEIQKRSDEKRGVKVKSFKLHADTIALLEKLAVDTGTSQTAVITKALKMLDESLKR